MAVITLDGKIIVSLPEYQLAQETNPATGQPWHNTAEAATWEVTAKALYEAAAAQLVAPPPAPHVPTPPRVIWTHLDFRRRFTQTEKEDLDELEATFETLSMLTSAQKKTLRSGYKDFNQATEIFSDDPAIPPMLALFVALGKLAANRVAVILNPEM